MKETITIKEKLFYKGYLDLENLNKAIDSTGTDGLVICERVKGKIETAVDVTRKTVARAEISESDFIEEYTQRGCLVFYDDILDDINDNEEKTAIYALKDLTNDEIAYVYTFKLLDETDGDNAVYYKQKQ